MITFGRQLPINRRVIKYIMVERALVNQQEKEDYHNRKWLTKCSSPKRNANG